MSADTEPAQILTGLLKINLEPGTTIEVQVIDNLVLVTFDFEWGEQTPLILRGEQAWQLSKALDIAQRAAGFRDFAQTEMNT